MYASNNIFITHKPATPREDGAIEHRYLHSTLHAFCSNELSDISPNKANFTVNGRVTASTLSPFEGQRSALFSGGFITTNVSSQYALGDTFTVDCWINPREISGETVLFDIGSSDRSGFLRISSDGTLYTSVTDTKNLTPKDTTIAANTWTHVAIAADSSGMRLYVNGSKVAYCKSRAAWPSEGKRLYIGADCGGGCGFNGYMSNLRFIKNVALYTTAFTLDGNPLPTSILIPV